MSDRGERALVARVRRRMQTRREVVSSMGPGVVEHRADVAGVPTAWLAAGDPAAPPVVLVHGALSSGLSWARVLPALAADHHVLAPDLPGYGDSGRAAGPYDRPWYAQWLGAFVADHAGCRADVVANSLGGAIATELAIGEPDVVRRLVLVDPVAVAPAGRPAPSYVWAVLRAVVAPRLAGAGVARDLWRGVAGPGTVLTPELEASGRYALDGLALPGGTRSFWRQGAVVRPFGRERLGALGVPTLVVWGAHDRITPPAGAEHLRDVVPGARVVTIPGGGHAPFLDDPPAVVAVVRDFLDELPADAGPTS